MANVLLVVGGPTASGKTSLAIELALHYKTDIVSFDSRQVFKEMNIGTAKPSKEELEKVPHHFINSISVTEEYNAGRYEEEAIHTIEHLFSKNNVVVLVGGSGMYLDAVLSGFDHLPMVNEKVREKLTELYKEEGLEVMQLMLKKLDKEHYANVDLNNPHRLIRALEVTISTGIPYSQQRSGVGKKRNFIPLLIGIDHPRELLYERINHRVDLMMQQGLLEEVKKLLPYRSENALQTVGYKELFDHLDGKQGLENATALIKQNTRRFAKRQLTWFRKYEEMAWLQPEQALEYVSGKIAGIND